ncbi:1-acyl-sn-glycerol-3-phosphate acyltransferase alpha [Cimex lectularius]|uniref:1-acyl-sn-glycerol-3-phosphate acyltransferase n=1 Tax=Cimex lectularius TaxID=79782 RepID=A0A8I6S949_CIMLE|nr:1-acyl-sn-glycerol-3-phosphate acyltransferase alpha [Cimex lectularius]
MMTLSEFVSVFVFLLMPILYEHNRVFRYYFKFFVYYGFIMITSIIVIPIMIWKPRNVENLILASYLCRNISDLLGLKWELRGGSYLSKDEAYVIVANHQSSIDILGMFELWPVMKKCTVVAKKELLYAGPFGLAAWLCGLVFIDRLNSEASRQAINNSINQLKENKIKMWVFPEGTRKNTGEIHAFKKGAFHAAISSQIPILPVVFTRFYFIRSKQCILDSGKIVITVLPPIETSGLNLEDMPQLMATTHTTMSQVFNLTSKELLTELESDRRIIQNNYAQK